MSYGVRIRVWGEYACFTRPEMKVERVSYDVITPSAARGILEAIHWKPAIKWIVDRIHVLNEIRFENVRRNEVNNKIPAGNVKKAMKGEPVVLCQYPAEERQQRASLILRDVDYIIEAHFEMTDEAQDEDTQDKHFAIITRRSRQGQCFQQPYLGCREFPAKFRLVEENEPLPISEITEEEKDLGWMLLDVDYNNEMIPRFFRGVMNKGTVEVPRMEGGVTVS